MPAGNVEAKFPVSQRYAGNAELVLGYDTLKGTIRYVDSNVSGGASGNGLSWSAAYLTLTEAVAAAKANDVIYVAPDHAETISGAVAINKDGLQIIGLGRGASRPTLTFSAVASSLDIDNDSVRLSNLVFLTTAACTIVIDVNDTDVLIDHCEFRRSSGTHPVDWIDVNGGSANACDRFAAINCVLNSGTGTGANQFIELGEVADGVVIRGCVVFGDFANACIHNPTGKVLTNLTITDCELTNLQTGDHSIELVSACTGSLIKNYYHNDMTQATGVDPGSCRSFECYQCDTVDVSGILTPVVT